MQGVTTIISQFPAEISLQCNFANLVDLESTFTADESDLDQTATDEENVSFTDGFTLELENASGGTVTDFTVGEPIAAKVCNIPYVYQMFYEFFWIFLYTILLSY